jgi:hypothetical protein
MSLAEKKYHSVITMTCMGDRPVFIIEEDMSLEERIRRAKEDCPVKGPWSLLRTHLGLVLGGGVHSRSFESLPYDVEYLGSLAESSLNGAIDAAFTLVPESPLAERVFVLLGGMSSCVTDTGERCLAAPRGTVAQLRRAHEQIIKEHC